MSLSHWPRNCEVGMEQIQTMFLIEKIGIGYMQNEDIEEELIWKIYILEITIKYHAYNNRKIN
jgi:hypothetical protein